MGNIIKQCGNCKFWRSKDDSYSEAIGAKQCSYVAFAPDATEWDEDCNRILKEEYHDIRAFVADASGYRAELYTKADFCCNQFQARDIP